VSVSVGILGASGRMGRFVAAELAKGGGASLAAAVVSGESRSLGCDMHELVGLPPSGVLLRPLAPGCFEGCDVVVDFSQPAALAAALPHLGERALVSGTTGLSAEQLAALDDQSRRAPVLWAANFSVGVTLLLELARQAARALPEADVEIVETHHRHKKDAPSGTALALGQAVAAGRGESPALVHGREGITGERPHGPIGMHALRGGDVVGEHTVWLLSEGERISLGHHASSRATFAAGAVRAARFVAGRPARRYQLREVLGLS
jgi:4-hydroxy-tetrahydrodipicolinate reductase